MKQLYCIRRNMHEISSCWMFEEPIVFLSIWLWNLPIWRWNKTRQILGEILCFILPFTGFLHSGSHVAKTKGKIQFNFLLAKFHNLKVVAFLSVFPKQIFSFTLNTGWKRQKMWLNLRRSVGFVLTWLHEIQRVNLINVLLYLTCCAEVTDDVISQRIRVLGRRFCGDTFFFFSIFLCLHWWDFGESKKDLHTSCTIVSRHRVSDYVANRTIT